MKKFGKIKKTVGSLAHFVLMIYVVSVMGAAPYFNWRYARDRGFVKWLLLGEVIATAKSAVWPYYLVRSLGQNGDTDVAHAQASFDFHQEAVNLINAISPNEDSVPYIPPETAAKILEFEKKALAQAERVDIDRLKRRSPEFADHFVTEYVKGLKLHVEGIETSDPKKALQGMVLMNLFFDWLTEGQEKSD